MAIFGQGFRLFVLAVLGYAVYHIADPGITERPLAQVTISQIGSLFFALVACFWIGKWAISFPEREAARKWGAAGFVVCSALFLGIAILVSR